jgi:hypothetical protein
MLKSYFTWIFFCAVRFFSSLVCAREDAILSDKIVTNFSEKETYIHENVVDEPMLPV